MARDALTGKTPKEQVRWRFAAEVRRYGIAEKVACSIPRESIGSLTRDWLREHLDNLLVDKVVSPDGLDLERTAAGASLHGWAVSFAKSAAPKLAATELRRVRKLALLPVEDIGPLPSPVPDCRIDEMEVTVSRYGVLSRGRRHAETVHLRAWALCDVFDLPEPPRLVDLPDREGLLHLIDSADASGFGTARQVLETWAGRERVDLEWLDRRVTFALAVAALTPTPPPRKRPFQVYGRLVEKEGGEQARELLEAWSRSVTELDRSEHSHNPPRVRPVRQRAASKRRYTTLAYDFAADTARGLFGATPEQISRTFRTGLIETELQLAEAS